ncbi:MAG TPA: hypothetical protein VGW10_06480 [Solirubrobacteraceae bacterium]|nr:hypothetical protein [Solirubrobacteraceae bacterium]
MFAAACGGASKQDVAEDWVDAVNDRDWERVCELTADPRPDCESDRRSTYDDGAMKLLPEGSYNNGGQLNDNETTFAFEVGGTQRRTGFFEVVERDGEHRVDVKIVILRDGQ